jgi:WD40 repeat protein
MWMRYVSLPALMVRWVSYCWPTLTSTDRTIKVWDRESGKCVQTLVGHRGAITSLQLSDDMIVSGSGTCLRSLCGLADNVQTTATSSSGALHPSLPSLFDPSLVVCPWSCSASMHNVHRTLPATRSNLIPFNNPACPARLKKSFETTTTTDTNAECRDR